MSRSFVLEPTTLPVSKANRFGEVTMIYEKVRNHPNPFAAEFQPIIVNKLKNLGFDPLRDYLVLSGRMTALVTMVAAAVAEYGMIKVLVYDSRDEVEDYQIVEMGSASLEGAL